MSDMNGNPYAATAIQRHAMVTETKPQSAQLFMVFAAALQGEATLALAYEQRTANLIAYVDKIDDTAAALPVVNEIKSRLGITEKED